MINNFIKLGYIGKAVIVPSLVIAFSSFAGANNSSDKSSEYTDWKTSICISGEPIPEYTGNFKHYKFANVNAPKGGYLRLSTRSEMNSLNTIIAPKGDIPSSLLYFAFSDMVTERLLHGNYDEPGECSDALIAEKMRWKKDLSEITFKINPKARWQDGVPLTVEDVIFSFESLMKYNPAKAEYYRHVKEAKITGANEVTFYFNVKNNSELPAIMGQLVIVPKHFWTAKGKNRKVGETSVELIPYSGPYKIKEFIPSKHIVYERDPNYWGKDLNVRIGMNNIGTIKESVYRDTDVAIEAFKAGKIDSKYVGIPRDWATKYDFAAVKKGDIIKEAFANPFVGSTDYIGIFINMRRELLKDINLRIALNLVYPFEEINQKVFYNLFGRPRSYYDNQDLAAVGKPSPEELKLLEPYKGKVPNSVFGVVSENPDNSTPAKVRKNLQKALTLLTKNGYKLKDGQLFNPVGKPVELTITVVGPTGAAISTIYKQALAKIGIKLNVNQVDISQFTSILGRFDYDIVGTWLGQISSIGNEQSNMFSSASAKQEYSQNYSGISIPAIDDIVAKLPFAQSRSELVTISRALDRLLKAYKISIPAYKRTHSWYANWKYLKHNKVLARTSTLFPNGWWIDVEEQKKMRPELY